MSLEQKRIKAVKYNIGKFPYDDIVDVVLWRDVEATVRKFKALVVATFMSEKDKSLLDEIIYDVEKVFFGNGESSLGNVEASRSYTRSYSPPKKTILHCDLCGLQGVETTLEKALMHKKGYCKVAESGGDKVTFPKSTRVASHSDSESSLPVLQWLQRTHRCKQLTDYGDQCIKFEGHNGLHSVLPQDWICYLITKNRERQKALNTARINYIHNHHDIHKYAAELREVPQ
ncbi:hypothetical protein LCGC14_2024240 [marine sediment metagenome]|uniref:Uncharacterized protein n=1 Tax=marine sediment metagenome TaxID=412755 RepID=A0A0F9EWL9_9ZZZZ